MIIVAVIGVLAALALPSFLDSIRKGRRSDAAAALAQLQQAQERWRANHTSYTATLGDLNLGWNPAGYSAAGYYGVAIDAADASGYTATASAVSGTSQASDSQCTTMRVRLAGGNLQYGGCNACALTDPLTDPNRCWSR